MGFRVSHFALRETFVLAVLAVVIVAATVATAVLLGVMFYRDEPIFGMLALVVVMLGAVAAMAYAALANA